MGNSSRKNRYERSLLSEVEAMTSLDCSPFLNANSLCYDVNSLNTLLLQRGVSVNTANTRGNTLLHYSVILNRLEVFNFLLNRRNMNLDAVNSDGHSALMLALMHNQEDYAVKLIRRGACINLSDNKGCTCLHYAITYSSLEFCRFLLEKGPNLDARNARGETALYLACSQPDPEKAHMLLYYGADASIACCEGKIPLFVATQNQPHLIHLHDALFDSVFGERVETDLNVLIDALLLDRPLFYTMIERVNKVTYTEAELERLNDWFPGISSKRLELIFEKFDYVMRDLFSHCCTLTNYLISNETARRVAPDFLDFLRFLLTSRLGFEAVQSCCPSMSAVSSLVKIFHKNALPLAKLTELVCIMLTYGVRVTPGDLNGVYIYYGRCELFNILLYMDIEKAIDDRCNYCKICDYEVVQESIMAHLIYNIDLTIERFLEKPQWYFAMDLDVLLDYFAVPRLKEFFLLECFAGHRVQEKVIKMPTVPYLTELARNMARKYIIEKFKMKSARHFYTVIKWLPIAEEHKRILCYEKKLYHT